MTTLVDWQIHDALLAGEIVISPFDPYSLQSGSVDLRLSDTLVDPADGATFTIPEAGYDLIQGDFLLGCTVEEISLCTYIRATLVGKSSTARKGLVVEAAGLVDQGFGGQLTLELDNRSRRPVRLMAGMLITQIVFERTMEPMYPYGSRRGRASNHYQGQRGPTLAFDSHLLEGGSHEG